MTEGRLRSLACSGTLGQLQVALEHLGDAVHPSVAQRPTAREGRERAGLVAVEAAVEGELVRFAGSYEAEGLEPVVDEGREAVVDLGQIHLLGEIAALA